MADNVLDIVHRITYEVAGQNTVSAIQRQFDANAQAIARNTVSLSRLQKALNETNDPAKQERIRQAIQNRTRAIQDETRAIQNTIQNNKQYQQSLQAEIGIINELNGRLKSLRDSRDAATSTKELQRLNTQITQIEAQRRKLLAEPARPTARLSLTAAQPTLNSNVLASPATPAAVASVRALTQELGIINQLNKRLEELRIARDRALNTSEIRNYTRQIAELERQQQRLLGGGRLGQLGSSILTGLGLGTGSAVVLTAISAISSAIDESSKFAAEIEGVRVAFDKINKPNLLDELRKATKGTVSDLELMKQAVQYNNLGLPVDRLGTALEFARRRAKETGVDVNYLIRSLVDGIGRQSILKVDNLGISMQAVRKEVARTGDFSTALFNIIEQGLKQAGPELDTFAERQARVAATTENIQESFGRYINLIKEFAIAAGKDIFTFGDGSGNFKYLDQFDENIRQSAEAAEEEQRIRINSSQIFERDYKQFLDKIASLDINSRNERLEQADAFYNADLARAKAFYGDSIIGFNAYQTYITRAYNQLTKQIASTPLNVASIAAGNITSATKNQLETAVATLEGQKGDLADGPEVQSINQRIRILREQLTKFDPIQKKAAKSGKDAYTIEKERLKTQAENIKLNDESLRSLNEQIDSERLIYQAWVSSAEFLAASSDMRRAKEQQFNDNLRIIQDLRKVRLETLNSEDLRRQVGAAERFNKPGDVANLRNELGASASDLVELTLNVRIRVATAFSDASDIQSQQSKDLKSLIDDQMNEAAQVASSAQDRINNQYYEKLAAAQDKEASIIEKRKQAYYDMYASIVQNAQIAIDAIFTAQTRAFDNEIEYRRLNVEKAKELALRGNTEVLEEEEEQLRKVTAARQQAADRQIQLNALLQASNMAVALSEAIGAIVKAAAEGDPYTVAARVIAAVAALVGGVAALSTAFSSVNSGGFASGGYTGDGGKYEPAGTVHKGEFVFNKETTAKNRKLFEQIHSGDLPVIPDYIYPQNHKLYAPNMGMYQSIQRKETADMRKQLGEIKEAILSTEINVAQRMDERGLSQSVEKTMNSNKRKFIR